jgi:hypothetical protein
VCESTSLGVIIYNRANAVFEAETIARLAAKYAHFIGFKDGIGNIEQLSRVRTLNGDRLFYLGGLPTAETYAAPLLRLGMSTYSSALFNFLPEFALEFYRDVRAEDDAAVTKKLKEFVLPYVAIRERRRGYGVSIVKAGLRSINRGCGPVRPPHGFPPTIQVSPGRWHFGSSGRNNLVRGLLLRPTEPSALLPLRAVPRKISRPARDVRPGQLPPPADGPRTTSWGSRPPSDCRDAKDRCCG